MNKNTDNKKEKYLNIILTAVCLLSIVFVSFFGLFFIKDLQNEIGIMEDGFRNLSQVTIYAGIKNGRGIVIYNENDFFDILTSKHLVSRDNNVSIEFGNGDKTDGGVVYYFPDSDAAIIRVFKKDATYPQGIKAVEVLSKSDYDSLTLSTHVYFLENISDKDKRVIEGRWIESEEYISEIGEEVGLFSAEVKSGMSGEGIFDSNDKLIGMIIAANETEGAIIPAYKLQNEYLNFLQSQSDKIEIQEGMK